jgi:hypothetical protein
MKLARTIGAVLIPICVGCAALIDLEPGELDTSSSGGGEGGSVGQMCASDADCPISNDCSTWACKDGACAVTVAPDDTPCGVTGQLGCVNGLCEGCSMDPANCNPPIGCQTVECPANTCMYPFLEGKVLSDPSDSDCKVEVCDAQGSTVIMGDPSEIPPQEGDNCKMEVCGADGNVAQVDANEGAKCADPAGACFNDSLCIAGACSPQPKPGGTPIGDNGIPGDCQAAYCDGNGGVVGGNNDADVPGDPNGGDCLVPVCMNGTPGQVPIPTGSGCAEQVDGKCCGASCCANASAGEGQFCDQGGACCASGKTCGGSCCASPFEVCVNDACCGGSICLGECCETQHSCAPGSGSCCPDIQRCEDGSCCPLGTECLGGNQCI